MTVNNKPWGSVHHYRQMRCQFALDPTDWLQLPSGTLQQPFGYPQETHLGPCLSCKESWFLNDSSELGGAIKAERVCQLVLLGVPPPPLVRARPRSEKQRSHGVFVLRQAHAYVRHATQKDTTHRKPASSPHQAQFSHPLH
jgi:hypothetical protein